MAISQILKLDISAIICGDTWGVTMLKTEGIVADNAVLVLLTLSRGAESRKRILTALLSGPKNCHQLTKELGFDWWTVRKHIQFLLKENMLIGLDFGRIKYYKLTMKGEELIRGFKKKDCDLGRNHEKNVASLDQQDIALSSEA